LIHIRLIELTIYSVTGEHQSKELPKSQV